VSSAGRSQLAPSQRQPAAEVNDPLPVAVIGCGRMGKLHARVYSQMPQVKLVGVYDANPETTAAVASEYGTRAAASVDELLAEARAVTIAVPTRFHAEVAEACLRRGVACLVEKPLAKDVAEGRRIVEAARRAGIIVQVGHIERFNPAVRAMTGLQMAPRFIEVIRISPMTFRSIDVGVVLDMMIHDIDIVLKLARSPVARIDAVGVSVIGDHEDICNARLTFANGCVANVTASRMALKTERKLRVFSSEAYVSVDYQKRYGVVVRRTGNLETVRAIAERIRRGDLTDLSQLNYADLVQVEELQISDTEPLRAQLESFASAVRQRTPVEVTAEDGLAAVETAVRIVEAMGKQAL
jgi:predicted dehydrogenase